MSILNKINIALSFFLVGFFVPQATHATHIVGGDMTYRCLGGDNYEITLTVRRDCFNGDEEAQFDDPATLGIFDNFGTLQVALGDGLGRSFVSPTSVTRIGNSLAEECRIPNTGSLCVDEAIYRDTIHLPFNKRGYFVAYQRCCRNVILNNIDNPLEAGATYYVEIIPEPALECNSQPTFNEWSDIYICAGEPFIFDHSATDPDGDELVYRICNATNGATINNPIPALPSNPPYDPGDLIPFSNGFSLDNVFGSGSPLRIDSATGELTATPEVTGTFLVGICVEEYRNGVLYSIVRRDFEINVVPCGDPISVDCDIDQGSLCDGNTTISVINRSVGADSFTWYFDFPNQDPAFMSTEQNPTFTYPASGNYTIRLEARRSSDGCAITKDIPVTIGGTAPKAEFVAIPISCQGDQVTVRFTDSTISGGTSFSQNWEINGQTFTNSPFILSFNRSDIVTVNYAIVTEEGCESNQNQAINLEDLINSPFFDLDLLSCGPGGNSIQLTNPAGSPTTWTITDANNQITTLDGSTVTTTVNTNQFTVSMVSDNGCDTPAVSEFFDIDDLRDAAVDVNLVSCSSQGNVFSFTNTTNSNATWTITDGPNTNTFTGDFFTTLIVSDNFSVSTTFDNSCYGTIDNQFNTNDFLRPDFDVELVSCSPNGTIFNFVNPTGTVANWTIMDGNNTSMQVGHTISGVITGEVFSVTIDLDNGCAGPFTETFRVDQFGVAPKATFSAVPISCSGDQVTVRFDDSTIAGSSTYNQRWNINGTTFNSSPITQTFNRNEIVRVELEIVTTNGCGNSIQNQTINLEDLINSAFFEVELVSCDASGTLISIVNPAGTPTTWTIMDGNNAPVTLTGSTVSTRITNTNFSVTMVTDNGCEAAPVTENFTIDDLIAAAVDVQLVSCSAAGNLFSFSNTTAANANWVIVDGNNTQTFSGDFFTTLIVSDNFTVTTTFDNSCYGTVENNFNANDFLQPDFDVDLVSCGPQGTIFNFINPAGSVANWTIVDGNNTTTQVGHTISGTITGDVFTVTIDLDNGCSGPFSQTFRVDQFGVAPKAEFAAIPISCSGNEVTIRFDDETISSTGFNQSWTINGEAFASSPITQTFDRSETILVEYEITTADGCNSSIQNQSINLEDLIASAFFEVDLISCDASGTLISLINPSGAATTWTIVDGNSAPITISGSSTTTTIASPEFTITMVSDNGCEAIPVSESFNLNDFFESAVDIQLVSCTAGGNIYSFTNRTNANASWTIVDGNNVINLTGDFVSTTVQGETITVTTTFDNSCYDPVSYTHLTLPTILLV